MANTIQIKRSSTASDTPSASDLSVGELAVNTADAKLFTKHTDGTVKELAGGGGSGISAVVDDTSPQLGGNLDSNDKNILLGDSDSGNSFANRIKLGAGNDLQLYHDGNNSVIGDANLGSADFGETYAKFIDDGAVELYHDNSKKLETTSTGAEVTGDLTLTSTEDNGAVLKLVSNDPDDVADFGIEGQIQFFAENDASESLQYYGMQLRTADVTDGSEDGWLYFNSIADGTLTNANALGSDGTLYFLGNGNAANAVIKWFQTKGTSHNVSLAVATPSADRTITLPDSTGIVLTTGNSDTPTTTTSSGDADFVLVDDGGTMKKITPTNLGIGGGGGGITVEEEGSALSTTATTLNFTGNGVTASGTGATKTIAVNGNEVLISSGTVSNVASIDFDSSVITGFEQYRVVLYNVTPASDTRELRMRLGTSNTAITSSIYQWALYQYGMSTGGSQRSAANVNANGSFFYLTSPTNDMGSNTGENCYAEVLLPNPNSTSGYKHVVARVSNYSYYPAIMGQRISAMAMREQSAINFITFYAESGNINTASFRLYGIS